MFNNNEICIGCHTCHMSVNCEPIKGNKTCPCVSCLVKSMCVTACKPFNEFFDMTIISDMHLKRLVKDENKLFNFKGPWPYDK